MPTCKILSIISCGSRESGAIQSKEYRLHLHLGVVAIEKGAFESPSTTVGQYIYIYNLDLVINNLQGLICRKTLTTNQQFIKAKRYLQG